MANYVCCQTLIERDSRFHPSINPDNHVTLSCSLSAFELNKKITRVCFLSSRYNQELIKKYPVPCCVAKLIWMMVPFSFLHHFYTGIKWRLSRPIYFLEDIKCSLVCENHTKTHIWIQKKVFPFSSISVLLNGNINW